MDKWLFYLATPYSHDDPEVREERFHMACDVAGHLMGKGIYVYSPIAHTHPLACRCDLPKGFEFWEGYDRLILSKCNALLVVMADGWAESKGVNAEILMARQMGIVVYEMWYPEYRKWVATFLEDLEP